MRRSAIRLGIPLPKSWQSPRCTGCDHPHSRDRHEGRYHPSMDLQLSSTALKVAEAMAAGKRQYVEQALDYLVTKGGSDLHLTAGSSPLIRLHGALVPIPGTPELTAADTQEVLDSFLNDPDKTEEFAQDNEVDFSFELDGVARFRVNAYRQRGSVSMVLRAIPFNIRTIGELDLPPVVEKLAGEERGLILVTGATG